jgi:hypothetical protein
MGLMMLAAGQGSKLQIRCEGPAAESALEEIVELIMGRFNEDCSGAANPERNTNPAGNREIF